MLAYSHAGAPSSGVTAPFEDQVERTMREGRCKIACWLAVLAAAAGILASAPAADAATPGHAPVLAMYYAWYDQNTWGSGKLSDQPVSPYISADRSTIERQVTQAQSAGIDGFALNWWGPGNPTDTNLQTLLSVAAATNFKVTVDVDMNSPFWSGPDDVSAALGYLRRYYDQPAWLHVDGRPAISFYAIRKMDVATWGSIRHAVDPNGSVLWIGEGDVFGYLQ